MTPTRFSLVAPIALLLISCNTLAQQKNSNPDSERPDTALQEKAFDLLESLAGQLSILQSAENRARIGSNIVGSLWTHDEKRARAVLGLVENDIKSVLQSPIGNDPQDRQTFSVFVKLRMDTVERVAKYNAETALLFLRATEPLSENEPYKAVERQRSLELRLAKQIERENPELALKLGHESLERGLSPDLLPLMRQMLKNHSEHASVFYKDLVAKVVREKLAENWNSLNFAVELAQSVRPPAIDAATFRDLLNSLLTTALAVGCDKQNVELTGICWRTGLLVRQMEQIDPARGSKLARWAQENSGADPSDGTDELNNVMESGSVDEILALAPKYPQSSYTIYSQAMLKAAISGDFELARKIANEYPGPERRKFMLDQVERYKEWATLSDEKLAEIQKTLNTLARVQDRFRYLLTVSNRIGSRNPKAAVKLLDQAMEIVNTMRAGKEQTGSQIDLAMMYCLEKSDRGFSIVESLIPRLNELVNAASKLDGYDNRYLREGEWSMTAEGGVGELLTNLAQNAGYFAWLDFDRAVTLAAQFERPEIRMMAQLKLAQGILAGPPRRMPIVIPIMN